MHHFNITDGDDRCAKAGRTSGGKTTRRNTASWYMGLEPHAGDRPARSRPNQTADLHYTFAIGADTRLMRVFGHRHFWTSNFSSWIEHADGKSRARLPVVRLADMPTYRYDSVVKNPRARPRGARPTARSSGVVILDTRATRCTSTATSTFTDARAATDNTRADAQTNRHAALRQPSLQRRDVHPVRQRRGAVDRPARHRRPADAGLREGRQIAEPRTYFERPEAIVRSSGRSSSCSCRSRCCKSSPTSSPGCHTSSCSRSSVSARRTSSSRSRCTCARRTWTTFAAARATRSSTWSRRC